MIQTVTKKKLKSLIIEESKTAKEYRKQGWKKPAKDEASHAKFFKKELKKLK